MVPLIFSSNSLYETPLRIYNGTEGIPKFAVLVNKLCLVFIRDLFHCAPRSRVCCNHRALRLRSSQHVAVAAESPVARLLLPSQRSFRKNENFKHSIHARNAEILLVNGRFKKILQALQPSLLISLLKSEPIRKNIELVAFDSFAKNSRPCHQERINFIRIRSAQSIGWYSIKMSLIEYQNKSQ